MPFIHFVNDDEKTIELITWSRRTIEKFCNVAHESHYPVEQAGIWANALRERKPFVVNDYETYPAKRGLPQGHAELKRFISVPVIENQKVVMLAGVGNKEEFYTDLDVETVQLIANEIWRLVQRKRIQKVLKIQQELLNKAESIAKIGSWEWEVASNRIYGSQEFYRITGFSSESSAINDIEIYRSRIFPQYLELFDTTVATSLEDGSRYELEYKFKDGNGDEICILEKGEGQLSDGKVDKLFGTIQDVSLEKKVEQQLKKQEDMILSQSRHAAMGEMIGLIAHQWRQPLSIIAMNVNNMVADIELDSIDPQEMKQMLQNLLYQTQKLSATIDEFRTFFKADTQKETFYLKDIISEIQKVIDASLENHGIRFSCQNSDRIALTSYKHELMQVLIHLLNNSKEALEKNKIADKTIECIISKEGESIVISICDNAGGVKAEYINKIFEPYFSTKSQLQSVGIGLYVAKTIVEQHLQGFIEAYNTPKGLCVQITLPQKQS